jgi:hypothetical protein
MLFRDCAYTCAHCGEVLDIPPRTDPQVMIRAASGRPNVRVLAFEGVEIHRCDVLGLNQSLPDRSAMQHIPA